MRIETLFTNGHILTMDPAHSEAEALAVADGRIVALGATAALLAQRERDTAVVDLAGRCACPGFVDPHNHFSLTALAPAEIDCRTPPNRSLTDIAERVRAMAQTAPAGAWLRGHGYDEELLAERRHPTRAELDEAAPDQPVVLVHWSVHRVALNSAALAALGIDAATPDPPAGWIVRDLAGRPSGLLYETATNGAQARSIAAYAERHAADAADLLAANARRLFAAGITSAGDTYVSPPLLRLYRAALAAGALLPRVTAYRGSAAGLFAPVGERERDADPFQPAGVKLFTDGGGNTTATTLACGHEQRGRRWLFHGQEALDELVSAAVGRDEQVAIHAAGDMAVTMALTALERARRAQPSRQPRLRIEHGVLLSSALIERLRAVSATLVVQPLSVTYHADKLATAPLAEGLRQLPLRDLLRAGVPVAASSDSSCYPLDPLLSVWAAVTRRTRAGYVANPEQRLTVEEALTLATTGAAHALGREDELGVLAPGRAADFVVLSADPRATPPDDLRRLTVQATYLAGSCVYDRVRDGAGETVGRRW